MKSIVKIIKYIVLFIKSIFTSDDATWTNTKNDCPFNEPLHYHHDGCPACIDQDWQDWWDEVR